MQKQRDKKTILLEMYSRQNFINNLHSFEKLHEFEQNKLVEDVLNLYEQDIKRLRKEFQNAQK